MSPNRNKFRSKNRFSCGKHCNKQQTLILNLDKCKKKITHETSIYRQLMWWDIKFFNRPAHGATIYIYTLYMDNKSLKFSKLKLTLLDNNGWNRMKKKTKRNNEKAVVIEINRKRATICVTHIHEQIDRSNKSIHFPNEYI